MATPFAPFVNSDSILLIHRPRKPYYSQEKFLDFIIIIIIIRIYLNRPELILSRGCGLAAQSWSQTSSPCLAVFGISSFHAK